MPSIISSSSPPRGEPRPRGHPSCIRCQDASAHDHYLEGSYREFTSRYVHFVFHSDSFLQYIGKAKAEGLGRNGLVEGFGEAPLKLKLSTPKSMGGKEDGQNPEQLFAMGYSCKLSTSFTKICESIGSQSTPPISLLPRGTPVRGST